MNQKKLANILKKIHLFADLEDHVIKEYFDFFELVTLKIDEVLFNQNEDSKFMGIVVDGKLRAELVDFEDNKKLIGYINKEETVGELGVLSGEARTLTVTADEPTKLLILSTKNFLEICSEHSSVMAKMMPQLVKRSRGVISLFSEKEFNNYAVILPGTNDLKLNNIINSLDSSIKDNSALSLSRINQPIEHIAKTKQKCLYLFESLNSNFFSSKFNEGGDFYVCCDASKEIGIDLALISLLSKIKENTKSKIYLVLMHPNTVTVPTDTYKWLHLMDFDQHYHIKPNKSSDIKRLIRYIIKKPIGLVLGGGGMKGWVHIGVLKLMNELNIPIDYMGGTSIGAAIGSCYGITLDFETTLNKINDFVKLLMLGVNWQDLTWPVISLYSGNNFTKAHKELFQEIKIEDLWLPTFCVSANLSKQQSKVHQFGELWKISRATTSLPGLLPPVMFDGDIHVDGGVINNLPTDFMKSYVGDNGIIIASDLQQQMDSVSSKFDFEPVVHLFDILLKKLKIRKQSHMYPSYSETVLQSLMLGSSMKNLENSLIADILINPDLFGYKMASINKGQKEELLKKGYDMAREKLEADFDKMLKPLLS